MRTSLVLTVLGDDKPGLVEKLSDEILGAGANWEESRMARLAGKFAGILRVSVDADQADVLERRLMAMDAGLTVLVERSAEPHVSTYRTLRLELLGHDRPGIIREISRALALRHVNIEELETDVTSAPMSGEALFRARALLRMPSTISPDSVSRVLEDLADELMVDLTVEPPEPVAAD